MKGRMNIELWRQVELVGNQADAANDLVGTDEPVGQLPGQGRRQLDVPGVEYQFAFFSRIRYPYVAG